MRTHVFGQGAGRTALTRYGLIALGALLLVAASGCLNYPGAEDRYDEEIVYSRYDPKADFTEFKTFAISPEVIKFDEDDGDIEREPLAEPLAADLVDQVVRNMEDRGYVRVESTENADLGLTVSVLSGTVTSYYSSYWGSYWGYPYYYYYYPYYYSYSYNVGTLVVDTVDLKNAEPPPEGGASPGNIGKLGVIWSGLVYGVLSSSTAENLQSALDGIDQAFEQSPYFRSE